MESELHSLSTIRIPLRHLTKIYGPDGLDMATDDLLMALSQVTGQENPNCVIEVDVSQRDPKDHALILDVSGLSSMAYAKFREKVRELQLFESE